MSDQRIYNHHQLGLVKRPDDCPNEYPGNFHCDGATDDDDDRLGMVGCFEIGAVVARETKRGTASRIGRKSRGAVCG